MTSYKSKMCRAAAAVAAASAFALSSCSADEVEVKNEGTAISFSTQVSRATEITRPQDLRGFRVWADAKGYKTMFINGDEATRDGNTNTFVLSKNYYWPNEVNSIRFWAYGPSGAYSDGGVDVTPEFSVDNQIFNNVEPVKSLENGGAGQRDFLVAYTEIKREHATGTTVPLQFLHAFSQVQVRAKLGDDSGKKVYIRGAWVVNAVSKASLSFKEDESADPENGAVKGSSANMNWVPASATDVTSYGVQLGSVVSLNNNNATTLIGGSDNSSLMLIPQTTGKITFDSNGMKEDGAYILLLCRVEAEHEGSEHPGGDDPVGVEGNKHYHQLFPVSSTYDKSQYGYTCVPVDFNWEPGKKYVYTLTFCGRGSGAGIYPPQPGPGAGYAPDDVTVVDPGTKKPGEHVLDNPISFEVDIDEWTEASGGDIPMQ